MEGVGGCGRIGWLFSLAGQVPGVKETASQVKLLFPTNPALVWPVGKVSAYACSEPLLLALTQPRSGLSETALGPATVPEQWVSVIP